MKRGNTVLTVNQRKIEISNKSLFWILIILGKNIINKTKLYVGGENKDRTHWIIIIRNDIII